MPDPIDLMAVRLWSEAFDEVERAFTCPTDRAHVMAYVALQSFGTSVELEMERGPEVARSLLTSLLEDIARNLSRDGRTVKINLEWREPEGGA